MSVVTEPLVEATARLARLYVADTGAGWVGDALVRIALAESGSGIGALAMQLSLVRAEMRVDGLLCDIDKFSQAPDGHDLCCDGECTCAGPSGPFAHPMCDTCQDRPADKAADATSDLLDLLDDRMLGFINHLLSTDKAAA